jgi:hypothetical protein
MTSSIEFKAGDTFSYSTSIPAEYLNLATNWSARAWVSDAGSQDRPIPKVDSLVCSLTAPVISGDPYALVISRSAALTDLWPRPSEVEEYRPLICDIELYDDSAEPIVHSTSSFIINIVFDPTRPA